MILRQSRRFVSPSLVSPCRTIPTMGNGIEERIRLWEGQGVVCRYDRETDSEVIRSLLAKQIASPVRWTGVMAQIGPVPALEVGPGKVLQGLAKRTDDAPDIHAAGTAEAIAAQSQV